MKSKILFIASIPIHFKVFHLPYLKWFHDNGYETHIICNGFEELPYVDKTWNICIERSPINYRNIIAYKRIKEIINREKYTLITCHTPVASVLARLASVKARKEGTKLLYTAHGFHFYKGAPLVNWLVYYPIEVILTTFTDAIICINNEDYQRIRKRGSKLCNYFLIPGIGVEKSRFFPIDEESKKLIRKKNKIESNKFLIIYSAEFINRKNHHFILKALRESKECLTDIIIIFAGKGILENSLKKLTVAYKLEEHVKFIGYRKDIDEIYKMSDLGISASKQEGLGLNLVEEMMCGLPVVATRDRGHNEVIDDKVNGILFEQDDYHTFIKSILYLKNNPLIYGKFRSNALKKAQKFEITNSLKKMSEIYRMMI